MAMAVEPPPLSRDVPEQLEGNVLDSKGDAATRSELETYNYFVVFVGYASCEASDPFNRHIIDLYQTVGRKHDNVAFVFVGLDQDEDHHKKSLRQYPFPFYTSYWKDMMRLTSYRISPSISYRGVFAFWRGDNDYVYVLNKDGSCFYSEDGTKDFHFNSQEGNRDHPPVSYEAALAYIRTWMEQLE